MSARVRLFRPEDAAALPGIFHAAVHGPASRDYTPAQCAAWSPAPGDPARWAARASDGRTTWVCVDAGDRPYAYLDLEPDGHLDHLYCHPDHAGTGAAAALYSAAEAHARRAGIRRIRVEASDTARGFFARRGFDAVRRNTVVLGAVTLTNTTMDKALARA